MSTSIALDPAAQAKAKAYARLRRRLFFVDLGLSGLLALAWLGLDWATTLRNCLLSLTTHEWLLVALFGAVFFVSFELLELPLAYYSGFVLPHQYGQSNQTLGGRCCACCRARCSSA